MKLGLQINKFNWKAPEIGPNVKAIASKADEVGFDSEWVMDHFFQITYLGPKTDPMLEAYTLLGYMAGVTKKVTLGTMVTGVVYREPALLIKAITTLDVLSSGRAILGIGAGWNEEEAVALGLGRPLAGGRFEKLEETLEIALQMWAGDTSSFRGKQYDLQEPISSPQPVQKPRPRILIGGGGEQKTLRFVAKYADACNLFPGPQLAHKLEVLEKHCDELGRDYSEIEKTALAGMTVAEAAADLDAFRRRVEPMAELGIQHVILSNGDEPSLAAYDKLGDKLIDELHKI